MPPTRHNQRKRLCFILIFPIFILLLWMLGTAILQSQNFIPIFSPANGPSHYDILQVRIDATDDEIRRAYRQQSLRWHPDKVAPENRRQAEQKLQEIRASYEYLLGNDRCAYNCHVQVLGKPCISKCNEQRWAKKDEEILRDYEEKAAKEPNKRRAKEYQDMAEFWAERMKRGRESRERVERMQRDSEAEEREVAPWKIAFFVVRLLQRVMGRIF